MQEIRPGKLDRARPVAASGPFGKFASAAAPAPLAAAALTVLLAAALFGAWAGPASAQVPDKFTNLEVFPKDVSKQTLVSTMRSFTDALGVRCGYCHVREGEGPEGHWDWASDQKPEKATARVMMKMTRLINTKELPDITTQHTDKVEVRCATCHRGLARPVLIQDVLTTAYQAGGIDSLSAKYASLRDEYYGTGSYDFGVQMLPQLSETLVAPTDGKGLLAFGQLEAKWFPDSGFGYLLMGEAHAMLGDKPAAEEELNKAMTLSPWLKERAEKALQKMGDE